MPTCEMRLLGTGFEQLGAAEYAAIGVATITGAGEEDG